MFRLRLPHKYIKKHSGFTIVELLIVIVVIGILAAITTVAYNGIQERARNTKVTNDLALLQKAILAARVNTDKLLTNITGSAYTATNCTVLVAGTDLASLPQTDPCWTLYNNSLNSISVASGMNVRGLIDPYGAPYMIDENETVTACTKDQLGTWNRPYAPSATGQTRSVSIPFYRTDC